VSVPNKLPNYSQSGRRCGLVIIGDITPSLNAKAKPRLDDGSVHLTRWGVRADHLNR